MVSFDAKLGGTPAETWAADSRLHDRPVLSWLSIDELVVVAAHPDDETLGASGVIAEAARRSIPVRIVSVTDGEGSHPDQPGLADRRASELAAAVGILAPGARVDRLGFPDGASHEHRDGIRTALQPLIAGSSPHALVVAPWRGDRHRDHRVVGEVVAELTGRRRLIEYPIWLWHWGAPSDVPWDRLVAVPVDRGTRRRALEAFQSQTEGNDAVLRPAFLANFDRDFELFVSDQDVEPAALSRGYFDETYERSEDPWGFESRWYEARKRAITLASLPTERYSAALEIGCSIGVLTEALADRCDMLLAVDLSALAVERARARLGDRATIIQADVTLAFPPGQFDLIVFSEVGYYFGRPTLERVLDAIEAGLSRDGTLVACHWRHPVPEYPLGGDEVHWAINDRRLVRLAQHLEEDFVLEVFSRDSRSVGTRTGLL